MSGRIWIKNIVFGIWFPCAAIVPINSNTTFPWVTVWYCIGVLHMVIIHWFNFLWIWLCMLRILFIHTHTHAHIRWLCYIGLHTHSHRRAQLHIIIIHMLPMYGFTQSVHIYLLEIIRHFVRYGVFFVRQCSNTTY